MKNILVLCRELFEKYEKECHARNNDKSVSGSMDANQIQVGGNLKFLNDFNLFTSKKKRKHVRLS